MDPLTQGTVGAAFSQSSSDKKNILKISVIGFLAGDCEKAAPTVP